MNDDDGDFHFLDAYATHYGTGAVDLVVYVEAKDEVRDAIRRQSAAVRQRLTRLILVSDALPANVLEGIDPTVAARIELRAATVVHRRCSEHEAILETEDETRRASREGVESAGSFPMVLTSGATCRLTVTFTKPGDLASALAVPYVSDALPRLTELHVVGGNPDVLEEAGPELKMRVWKGAVAFVQRTQAEQDDIDADSEAARLVSSTDASAASASRADVIRRVHDGPRHEPRPADPRGASLATPPITATSLTSAVKANDDTPPRGLMAAHLGAPIDRRNLSDGDSALDAKLAGRVRGWDVPALRGQLLVIHDVTRVASALRGLLFACLGDVPFRVEGGGYGGLAKYLQLHTSVIAPPDGVQAMALELYGRVVTIGDPRRSPREMGRALLDARRREVRGYDLATRAGRRAAALAHVGGELPMPICVRLDVAVYANVMFPGVDVPFYM